MNYDYAVIGAGVAGTICAYQLANFKKTCIVFEKNDGPSEKICGGGVSYKALNRLEQIGIDTKPLFECDSQAIIGHTIYRKEGLSQVKKYADGKKSLGIQRHILDSYILDCAINKGAEIRYGYGIENITYSDGLYQIGSYYIKDIVWATGARSICGNQVQGQSIGYSGQIYANMCIPSNLFYYWYYEKENKNKYFWVFPIGENLWNVGIWSRYPFCNIKSEYNRCLKKYFLCKVEHDWKYYRTPRAEFLGHIDQREKNTCLKYGVGDFAGKCNPLNGGGIIGAIDSSVEFVKNIVC